MYHYLTGQLVEKAATSLVIDAGGIGYFLQIPLSTYEQLPPLGQTVKILTYFVVREDAHLLCGFLTEDERQLFKMLISVSGIGPKLAMTVLSGMSIADLKRAIVDGSVELLKTISGIGKKTAERIVIELREKLVLDGQKTPGLSLVASVTNASLVEDSVEALVALGYRKQNAKTAVEKVLKDSQSQKLTVEDLIRASLKLI